MNLKSTWNPIDIVQIKENKTISHMTQDAQLIFILSGSVIVEQGDLINHFRSGEFILIPNFSSITISLEEINSRVYQMTFAYKSEFNQNQLVIFTGDSKSKGESAHSTLSQAIGRILRLYYLYKNEASYWEVNALYFQIIAKLEQKYLVKMPKQVGRLSENEVLNYLMQHLAEDLSLDSVADHFYVSKQTLNRFFKAHFGLPFGKFLQEKRFEAFITTLVTSDDPINTLAYGAGFKNINSFNRLFKSKYGESPLIWREKNRQKWLIEEEAESSLVEDDFIKLQVNGEFHYFADRLVVQNFDKKQLIWTITHPSQIIGAQAQKKFDKLSETLPITTLRFTVELSHHPLWVYQVMLSECQKKQIQPCLVLQVNNVSEVNQIMIFLRKLLLEDKMDMRNWRFEIDCEINKKSTTQDWQSEYNRFYNFIKNLIPTVFCGIGNLHYQDIDETFLSQIDLLYSVDFVSLTVLPFINHFSQYSRRNQIVSHSKISQISPTVIKKISLLKESIPGTPIFVSQFGLTGKECDSINDHVYLASYLLAFINNFLDKVDGLGGYSLFDSNLEGGEEFTGQPGLVSKSGLMKASFYSLNFYRKLYPFLLNKEDNFVITYDGEKKYRILTYQYHSINDFYSSDKEMDIYQHQQNIFQTQNDLIQFHISNVENGTYKMTYHILDPDNGSGPAVQAKYTGLNLLDERMINFIETQYRPKVYQKEITVTDNEIIEKIVVKPLEVLFVEIEKYGSK